MARRISRKLQALKKVPRIKITSFRVVTSRKVKKVNSKFKPVGRKEIAGVQAKEKGFTRSRFFVRSDKASLREIKRSSGKFRLKNKTFVG